MLFSGGIIFSKAKIFLIGCLTFIFGIGLASFLPASPAGGPVVLLQYKIWWFTATVFFLILTVLFWRNGVETRTAGTGRDPSLRLVFLFIAIFLFSFWRYAVSLPVRAPDKIWYYNLPAQAGGQTVTVLGLVANVLKEEHGKPVFLWGRDDNAILKGSCRSDGVNVMELMTEAREVFVEFGGHSLSGGFTVIEEKIHILEEELDRAFGRLSPQAVAAGGEFLADAALALDEVDTDTYGLVEKLAPFGVGNPKPIFLLKNESFGNYF